MSFLNVQNNPFSSVMSRIGQDLLQGGVGQVVKDILGQLTQSLFQNTKGGQMFSNNLSLFGNTLPNPASGLNGYLSGFNQGVQSNPNLQQILSMLSQAQGQYSTLAGSGAQVQLPQLQYRLPVAASQSTGSLQNYAQNFGADTTGSLSSNYQDPNSVITEAAGQGAFSDAPSADESAMLSKIKDPAERARMELQLKLQKQAEIAQMVSTILAVKHQTNQAIIGNFK